MHENKSLKLNIIYAFLLQSTNFIFPLITTPYISHVIGAEYLGKINFATSVSSWFGIFAYFGTITYGVREVARLRNNNKDLSRFFSEIIILKMFITVITVAVYLPVIFVIPKFSKESLLFIIQGITLVLNIFSIDWFFQGIENYRYITIRSLLVKIISVAAIFIFINEKNDYLLYAMISVLGLSFNNLLCFLYANKYVKFTLYDLTFRNHIRPLSIFFFSSLVISIYKTIDVIILGFIKGDLNVAYFVRAKLLLMLGVSLATTISSVMMPRLTNYFTHNKEKYNELLSTSNNIILLLSFPIAVGLLILSKSIMYLFGGQEFLPATTALIIMIPLIFMLPIGSWNYSQRLLPNNFEKIGLHIQCIMATISIIINVILVQSLGFIGTAIAYLITESIGTIVSFAYMKSKDNFIMFNIDQLKYLFAALIMGVCVVLVQSRLPLSWLSMFICAGVGSVVYFTLLLISREKIVRKIFYQVTSLKI